MTLSHLSKQFGLGPRRGGKQGYPNQLNLWKTACAVFVLFAASAIVATAQTTFTTLLTFNGANGEIPWFDYGSLVQGFDGNLYGTTINGGLGTDCGASINGSNGCGTIFKIAPTGELTTLYSFCDQSNCADGALPEGALALGADGNLYGTTTQGGASQAAQCWSPYVAGCGTIFKITTAGELTTIYSFCAQTNCSDGVSPTGGLVQAGNGNFYGTTTNGGSGNGGTVFQVTLAGRVTTIHTFCSQTDCTDGFLPNAGLIQGTDNNFYGTTVAGGSGGGACPTTAQYWHGCGSIFKITPAGVFTTLYRFCIQSCADGNGPLGKLLQASDGNLYGTTWGGGNGGSVDGEGAGTIFRITLEGTFTKLHDFCLGTNYPNCPDGTEIRAGLVEGTNGVLFGTASWGGKFNNGTIFAIHTGGSFNRIYSFCAAANCADGAQPFAALIQATNGNFYGTSAGGYPSNGTIYGLSVGLRPFVSFIPSSGKVGQTVQILGQGLTGTTKVVFNGKPAAFVVRSDTYLTATVPAGTASGIVSVTTPGGTLTSRNKTFRVTPQIGAFSPADGPAGTSVVITGQSLSQASVVTFDCTSKASFIVNSDTQITAIVPLGAASGKIGVTTAGGHADSTSSFTVTP